MRIAKSRPIVLALCLHIYTFLTLLLGVRSDPPIFNTDLSNYKTGRIDLISETSPGAGYFFSTTSFVFSSQFDNSPNVVLGIWSI